MARRKIARLSPDELEILRLGRTDPSIISRYFWSRNGAPGWEFDYNFDPEGAYQKTLHQAAQKRIIVIGGFGSGKTRTVGISACVWAMTTLDFKFMNAAPLAWQSALMYNFILDISRETPFERLIYEKPKAPYPKIELRFWAGDILVVSTLEFMSVEKNSNNILGWEGDWANIDEGGQLDDLEGTITNLGSRMRGSVAGRTRLGRLSITTNSWDNPELWYRFDLAQQLPKDYLSLVVSTRHNHNVTQDQLRMMLKDIPEDEHDRFIDGHRPEGKGKFFNKQKVWACEDAMYAAFIDDRISKKARGFEKSSSDGAGVSYFKIPMVPGNIYMIVGDPGTENAPGRNSPVLQVWDMTDFPKKKGNMAAFWWGAGNGSITPWLTWMFKFMEIYNPAYTFADSTGPQKNTAEIINTYLLGNRYTDEERKKFFTDIDFSKVFNPTVTGLDFSGGRKPAYLISGKIMLEAELMIWPKWVTGMRSQLTNYDPEKDVAGKPKIPQDLVATFCMSSYVARVYFNIAPEELGVAAGNKNTEDFAAVSDREIRLPSEERFERAR